MTDIAPTASPARSIVFIDSRVQDAATLLQGLEPGTEVVFLQAGQDGLAQMADALQGRTGVDAIHVLSHGQSGQLQLGSLALDQAALTARADMLAQIGSALSDSGDILLYGCDVASGEAGAPFISQWAKLTQADVAASTNRTGASHLGGDWVLEAILGQVEDHPGLKQQVLATYAHVLTTPADTNFNLLPAPDEFTSPITINGITYSLVSPGGGSGKSSITAVDTAFSITPVKSGDPTNYPTGFDLGLVFNMDPSTIVAPGPVDARITSTDGSEFRMVSMEVDTGAGLTTSPNLTFTGYRNGFAVASDTVNTGVSDAVGSMTYAKNGVSTGFGGTLTFGSDWYYIDEIRITGINTVVAIDDLDFEPGILPDTTPPTVTSLNSSTPNGTYKVGDVISIQVNFSENVVVAGGTPQLTLETGGTDRAIDYTSGTGSSTLTFTYLVQAGDTTADLDYTAINALALNGSTLRDAAGNNAIRTLASPGAANSLGANKAIVIDGVAPTVTSVTAITANGTYKVDDVISIQVNFSEAVTVTGTPQLTLETGGTDRPVSYASGAGTSTLTFTYTVQAGDTTADLDYFSTSALALNGGSIRDAADNYASLTLPSPGAANSLGNNKAIIIDTTAPAAPSTPDLASASDSGISSTDNITNATTPTFTGTAESGSTVRLYDTDGITVLGSAVATGGSWAIPSSNLSQGTHIVTARATDAAGNVGDASTGLSVTIDTLAPAAPSAPDLASASDTGVSNSDNITTDTTPTVSGTAEAGATVTLYDTDGTTVLGTGIATGGNWSITSSALAAGTHTLTTKATDAAGNVSGASAGLAVTIVTASPPTISNLNGDSVGWAGVGNTVTLDFGGNAVLGDAEFGALNSGSGDWSGASLTVQRAGTAVDVDTLGVNTWGSLFTASGSASSGNLQSGGQTFATYTHTGGVLTIHFTSSGTAATTELVNDVARHITYRNDTPAGDATLRYTLSDGTASTTADVAVTSNTIYVTNVTDTATIDVSDGVSLSEAIAIAALDATGSQTIVIAPSLAGQTLTLAGNVAINESLTLDLSAANDVALAGSTLTLGGGATLTVVNGAGNDATIYTALAGSGALVTVGLGDLLLMGSNGSHSGSVSVNAGTLHAIGGSALGDTSAVSVQSGATLVVGGNETTGSLAGAGSVLVPLAAVLTTGSANTSTTFSGSIIGAGGLSKVGTGTLTLSGGNTHSGGTQVDAGTLGVANGLGLGTGAVTLGGGTLEFAVATTIANAIQVTSNSGIRALADTTLSGALTGAASLDVFGPGTFTLANAANNLNVVYLQGSSRMLVNGGLTASYINASSGTTLLVNGALTASNIHASSGSTLGGSGTIGGDVYIWDATLSPGSGADTGVLTINGNLSLNDGSTLTAQINGPTPGTGYDQVVVNGTVSIHANTTLAVTHGYTPASGDAYTLILNDVADAVAGAFNGLAEGGTRTAGGNGTVLTASYVGGTGNDVTLTAPTNAPPVATTSGGSTAFVEGSNVTSTWVAIDSGITLSDADNATLASATVAITGNFQSGEDVLGFTSNSATKGNITGSYNSATGVLTLTSASASATLAQWQTALRSVTYTNTSDNPNTASRTLSFTVNDGNSDSSAATRAVTVTPVNETPTFAPAAPGTGKLVTDIGSGTYDLGFSVTVQADGKIVVAGASYSGSSYNFAVVRYNADGSLDTNFNGTGKLVTDFGSGTNDVGYSVTVQADGKIVVAGVNDSGGSNNFAVVRYNADGSLDTNFNGTGKLVTDFGSGTYDVGQSVTVQADGKIVVAGTSYSGGSYNFAVVRYNTDGSLDTSLGGTGKLVTDIGSATYDEGRSVTVQADGKIVVTGYSNSGGSNNFAVARYNTDGSLDTGFGSSGKLVTDFGSGTNDQGQSVTVQTDGKIVVAGYSDSGGSTNFAVARYNTDGSLDTGFNSTGKLVTDFGSGTTDEGRSVTVQTDGKIVVAGISDSGGSYNFAVVRYNTDGSLDTSFGSSGKLVTDFGSGTYDFGQSVTVQADGKIVVAGYSNSGGSNNFAVVRYNTDGSLDTSFNPGPAVNTLGGAVAYTENASAIALDTSVVVFDADLAALNGGLGNYSGASVTLARAGGSAAEDVFSALGNLAFTAGSAVLSGTTVGTVSNTGGTLTISFNANATQARVNEVLSSIGYANTSEAPPPSVQVDWSFSDGNTGSQGSGGALTAAGSTTVNITAVNDAPVATTSGGAAAFTEGANATSTPVAIDSGITLSDADNATLASATVAITGNFHSGEDVLGFTSNGATMGNITASYDSATGVLTLTSASASATLAQWQTALRAVTYTNSSENPNTASRTLSFTVNDGTSSSIAATRAVTVAAVNDAPTVANAVPDQTASEGSAFNFQFAANTFVDVDVGDTLSYTAQLAGGGALPAWLSFDPGTRTFSGTPANVGTVSIEVVADDGHGGTVSDRFELVIGAAPVDPGPDPVPPVTPPVLPPTPAIPDNDGVPSTVEDQAPGIPGPGGVIVAGDGNGDGIKDSLQAGVASIGFLLSPTAKSNPGDAPPTFTTLVASSQDGKVGSGNDNSRITSLQQLDAPQDVPEGMQTPLGLVSFTVALAAGKTGENFSLYLDPALGINGYWKQDASGTWVNLASEPYGGKMVMEGGRLRLDFHIDDGGQFDADGKVDGIITDPGAPAHLPLSIVGHAPELFDRGFWF